MPEPQVSFGFRKPPPVVRTTLIVLLVAFVLLAVGARFSVTGAEIYRGMVLEPARVLQGEKLWSLLTYALVHSLEDPWHLLFNGMVLYFFAPELEELWGKTKFIAFMLTTALGGALLCVLVALVGLGSSPVVGASAICVGALVAWGLLYPDRQTYFFFFKLKGIHMVLITIGFELLNALTLSGTSASAHFGGMIVGAAWAGAYRGPVRRWFLQRRLRGLQAEKDGIVRKRAASSGLRVIPGGQSDPKSKRFLN